MMNLKEELERLFQTSDGSSTGRSVSAPRLSAKGVPVETLMDIVQSGGKVRTGIDIFNRNGVLLLEKNKRITDIKPLLIMRQNGIFEVPISPRNRGGLWDASGRLHRSRRQYRSRSRPGHRFPRPAHLSKGSVPNDAAFFEKQPFRRYGAGRP